MVPDFLYNCQTTCHPSATMITRANQLVDSVIPKLPPAKIVVCWLIIVQINGTDIYVLCFERRPANANKSPSGAAPFFIDVIIDCCAGQILNHTLNAIIVPNIAPK